MCQSLPLLVNFWSFHPTNHQILIEKTKMLCLEFEPGATGLKAQTDPPSNGSPRPFQLFIEKALNIQFWIFLWIKTHRVEPYLSLEGTKKRIFNLLSLKRIINFKSQSEGLDGTVKAFLPVILKVLGSSPLQDEERLRLLCFKEPRQWQSCKVVSLDFE